MRYLNLLVLLLLPLGACSPLLRLGDIEPPEGKRVVVDVEVLVENKHAKKPKHLSSMVGNLGVAELATASDSKVAMSTILGELSTSVQGMSVSAEDAVLRESEVLSDARRLESIYQARGYFQARTVATEIRRIGKDRAKVVFTVDEGEPTLISELRFLGTCDTGEEREPPRRSRALNLQRGGGQGGGPAHEGLQAEQDSTSVQEVDEDELRLQKKLCQEASKHIQLSVGEVWTEDRYVRSISDLARVFRDEGFLHVQVTANTWVSMDSPKAAIWYQVESGPLVRMQGEVRISGQNRVSRERIMRRVDLKPGDILSRRLLKKNERQVLELGPFLTAQLLPQRTTSRRWRRFSRRGSLSQEGLTSPEREEAEEEGPNKHLSVRLQVVESPAWEVSLGPSVVSDFVRLDLALPLKFTHRNLFSEVVSLEAAARPALVFPNCFVSSSCGDELSFGMDSKVTLQVPSFFEEYLRFTVDAIYRRDPSQSTKSDEVGGALGLSRRIIDGLTARAGYNVSYFNYFGSSSLSDLGPEEALRESALRFEKQDLLAWFDLSLSYDLRDNPLDARNGIYSTLGLNWAHPGIGSDVAYTKLFGEFRAYWTPSEASFLSLAARVRLGWNFWDEDKGTPQPARFRSGGASTMRGFSTNRMGDFVCVTPDDSGRFINNPGCGKGSTDRTYIGGNYLFESNFELRFHLGESLGLVLFTDIGKSWSRFDDLNFSDLYFAVGPGLRYDLPVGPIRFDLGFLLGENPATEFHFSLGQAF